MTRSATARRLVLALLTAGALTAAGPAGSALADPCPGPFPPPPPCPGCIDWCGAVATYDLPPYQAADAPTPA